MAITSPHHDHHRQAGRPAAAAPHRPRRAVLTAGEVLVGGTILLVGLAAWAGLASAHLGRFSLLVVVIGTALAAAALLAAARLLPGSGHAWPRAVVDRRELAALAALALLAGVLNFPGFPYGLGDKDPGTYVSHGIWIARSGTWQPTDPVLDPDRAVAGFQPSSPGARLPGLWYEDPTDGHVTVQFYHLWSAALAVAYAAGGLPALVNLAPLLGLLSVLAVALATGRAFGPAAGALAGLLLATSMLQVWQAKYPSAEIMTQLLVSGALLGVVVAARTGWAPAAGSGGLLLGLAYLTRADTLLLLGLAAAAGAALLALGRADARAGWFAAGLALTLPHGLLQAYGLAGAYTRANGVPGLPLVAGGVAAAFALAWLARTLAPRLGERAAATLSSRRAQVQLGAVLTALAVAALALAFLRPWLFGPAWFDYNGQRLRSYDEQTLRRLSWFVTIPGLALMTVGLALVALRRWTGAAWALVLPLLVTFPVYAVAASNSSRLMWWSRRFVPVVLPGITILIAVALAAALAWHTRNQRPRLRIHPAWVRAGAAACALFLAAAHLNQSLPLRGHHEMAGSFQVTRRLAGAAGGEQGVFLLDNHPDSANLAPWFGVPLWLQHAQVAVLLRSRPSADYVTAFARGFPGQPVFLVVTGPARPAGYDTLPLRRVDHIRTQLPTWDESDLSRPAAAHLQPVDLSVWKVQGTG